MIPWMQKPSDAKSHAHDLTDMQMTSLFAAALLAMPVIERASVMNCLLHRERATFNALLLREPVENTGRVQCPR
jgi:hypothetical protein